MFILKKIIAQFFFPLPLIVFSMISGLFLLWFTKKQKLGKTIVTIGTSMLIIFSFNFPSNMLIKQLERKYESYSDEIDNSNDFKYIVVLGGGAVSDSNVPITSQLIPQSMIRLLEGIRIYYNSFNRKLILSGGAVFNTKSEAEIMADFAKNIGVRSNDIVIESSSRNTKEQAQLISKIIGAEKLVLVTSASHMPRAMALFKKQGMRPIPAPTEHLFLEKQKIYPVSFFPNADALRRTERFFYEIMGMTWSKLCGDI